MHEVAQTGTPDLEGTPGMNPVEKLPQAVSEEWDWQLRAACRGADSELFFHPSGERDPARTRRELAAKAVCARCPVIDRCLDHALALREPYGVWGGRSEEERAAIVRRRDRAGLYPRAGEGYRRPYSA
jgi:WhiB family redox-sensing transcriptional regulator